ncbi:MAG: hypothetical protein WKF59_13870 [Chitinophagaceae bacterium]
MGKATSWAIFKTSIFDMMYNIGEIVKNNKSETCIVLARKTMPLTSDYLNSLKGEILIKGINEMAKTQIHVPEGFDYVVARIKSFEGKYCTLDDLHYTPIFGDDLIRY